jgi:hypothetical protein
MQIYDKLLDFQISNCKMLGIKPTVFFYSSRVNLPNIEISTTAKGIVYDIMKQMQKHRTNGKPILEQLITNITFDVKDMIGNRNTFYKAMNELEANHFLFKKEYRGYDYIVNPFQFNVLTFNQAEHLTNHLSLLYEQRYGRSITEPDTPEFGVMLPDKPQLLVPQSVSA